MFQVRTDLALETKEKFEEDNVELKGVRIHEEERGENIKITEVIIETETEQRVWENQEAPISR